MPIPAGWRRALRLAARPGHDARQRIDVVGATSRMPSGVPLANGVGGLDRQLSLDQVGRVRDQQRRLRSVGQLDAERRTHRAASGPRSARGWLSWLGSSWRIRRSSQRVQLVERVVVDRDRGRGRARLDHVDARAQRARQPHRRGRARWPTGAGRARRRRPLRAAAPSRSRRTSVSTWRTDSSCATVRRASVSIAGADSRPSSARAWPIDSRPSTTSSRTPSGSFSRRSELATVLRSLPTRSASDSCV